MLHENKKAFHDAMSECASAFGIGITEKRIQSYFLALMKFPIEPVKHAFIYFQENKNKFPLIADLKDFLKIKINPSEKKLSLQDEIDYAALVIKRDELFHAAASERDYSARYALYMKMRAIDENIAIMICKYGDIKDKEVVKMHFMDGGNTSLAGLIEKTLKRA